MADEDDGETPLVPTGLLAHLTEGRLVFLGRHDARPDTWLIGFRNADGDDTRLALSDEAMAWLVSLHDTFSSGGTFRDTFPPPIKAPEITFRWTLRPSSGVEDTRKVTWYQDDPEKIP